MADFPLHETTKWSYSAGSTITAGAANTKGGWVEFFASIAFEVSAFEIITRLPSGSTNYNYLIDIGIGAAGSEVVIVSNLYLSRETYYNSDVLIRLPFSIPQGTRISIRCQSSQASAVLLAGMYIQGQGFAPSQNLNRCYTLGAVPATSRGTQIDPGAVASTKGAWVEFSSSLPYPISFLACRIGMNANTAYTRAQFNMDVGIGAAGSEVVIVPDLIFSADSSNEAITPDFFENFISIAEGQRLVVRASCSITDATDRLFSATLHCVH